MNKILVGGLAGALATVPMTVAMTAMHRALPGHERYPLPPKQITKELAGGVRSPGKLDEPGLNALTMLAHVGYGTVAGSFYTLGSSVLPGSPAVRGAVFGLGVWTTSYLGLLPLAGVLAPATEHPTRRNALMITAHVVWGAGLGLLEAHLKDAKPSSVPGR